MARVRQDTAAGLIGRPPLYHGADGAPRYARLLSRVPVDLAALGVGLFFLISGYVIAIRVPVLAAVHVALLSSNPIVHTSLTYRATFVAMIVVFGCLCLWGGRWRAHPVTGFFADISYPLYVVHPVLGYALLYAFTAAGVRSPVALAATAAAAIATAWLLHVCIERPTHRLGTRWARRLSEAAIRRGGPRGPVVDADEVPTPTGAPASEATIA